MDIEPRPTARPAEKDSGALSATVAVLLLPLAGPRSAGGTRGGGSGGGAAGGGGDGGGGEGAGVASNPTVGVVVLITETPRAAVRAVGVELTRVALAAVAALAVGRMSRVSTRTLAGATVSATSMASGKRESIFVRKAKRSKVDTSPATVKLVRMTCW